MKPSQQDLVPLYTEKRLPSTELARIFEATPAAIIRWLRSYGVTIRPTGRMAKSDKMARGTDLYLDCPDPVYVMTYDFKGHEPMVGDRIIQKPPLRITGRAWVGGTFGVLVMHDRG